MSQTTNTTAMSSAMLQSLQSNPIKINKWNIQEVRVAFDDLIVKFMKEDLEFKEDNLVIVSKIYAYGLLNALGIATALYAYLVKPFSATRPLVAVGSFIYLILLGIWTLSLQYYIIPTIFRGCKQNKAIWLRSHMAYPEAEYYVQVLPPQTGPSYLLPNFKAWQAKAAIKIPVGQWIDEGGQIFPDAVLRDLKSHLASAINKTD